MFDSKQPNYYSMLGEMETGDIIVSETSSYVICRDEDGVFRYLDNVDYTIGRRMGHNGAVYVHSQLEKHHWEFQNIYARISASSVVNRLRSGETVYVGAEKKAITIMSAIEGNIFTSLPTYGQVFTETSYYTCIK